MPFAEVLGLDQPFAPFDSGAPGHTLLLLVRLGILGCVIVFGAPRRGVVSALGALFILSIVARIFVLPDLLACFAALFVLVPRRLAFLAAALVAVGIGMAGLPPKPVPPRDDTVAAWRARKNLWRARAVALQAAKHESPPGEAYVELAEVDDALGRREQARKVVKKVLATGTSEVARAKATALEASWHE